MSDTADTSDREKHTQIENAIYKTKLLKQVEEENIGIKMVKKRGKRRNVTTTEKHRFLLS